MSCRSHGTTERRTARDSVTQILNVADGVVEAGADGKGLANDGRQDDSEGSGLHYDDETAKRMGGIR